jgi:uncharacterized protein YkwD
MRRVVLSLAIAVVYMLRPGAAAAAQQDHDQASFVARVLDLTNAERQNAGLAPLSLSSELEDAAQSYSDVLASSDCFAHTCGPVTEVGERDAQAGYTGWSAVGENIAAGYATPEDVVAGWMASPGHRANILSRNFAEIGIGVSNADGQFGIYWTQEFGARGLGPTAAALLENYPIQRAASSASTT